MIFSRMLRLVLTLRVPTLLCGDFNSVFDRLLDRVGSEPFDAVHESSASLSLFVVLLCP